MPSENLSDRFLEGTGDIYAPKRKRHVVSTIAEGSAVTLMTSALEGGRGGYGQIGQTGQNKQVDNSNPALIARLQGKDEKLS